MPDPGADLRITNDGDLSHAIAQLGRWWQSNSLHRCLRHDPAILVTQPVHADVAERISGLGMLDLHPGPERSSPEELAQRLAGATAVIGFMTDRIDAEALRDAHELRIVACTSRASTTSTSTPARAGVWPSMVRTC